MPVQKPLTFTQENQPKHKATRAKPPHILCGMRKGLQYGHYRAGTAFRGKTGIMCVRQRIIAGNAAGGCHVELIPSQGYKNS